MKGAEAVALVFIIVLWAALSVAVSEFVLRLWSIIKSHNQSDEE